MVAKNIISPVQRQTANDELYPFAFSSFIVGRNHAINLPPFDNLSSKAPLLAIGIKPDSPVLFYDIDITGFPENDIVTKELDEIYNNFLIPKIIFNDDAVKEIRESNSIYERIKSFIDYKERTWFYAKLFHYHWAIYITKHGWHIVMKMPTWERVQFSLYELKVIFPKSTYPIYTKALRLRISPKWNRKTGKVVSEEPQLFESCKCYKELRTGTKESYYTYD